MEHRAEKEKLIYLKTVNTYFPPYRVLTFFKGVTLTIKLLVVGLPYSDYT